MARTITEVLMAYDDLNNKTNDIAYLNGAPYS
jgi:hypothetical protein